MWGLEPDPEVHPDDNLFDRYECSTMEDAELPPNSVSVCYSAMVMEHVVDPDEFLAAVFRCLKPGGTYLFITPNGRHYFTRIASFLRRLRADEQVGAIRLRALHLRSGSSAVEPGEGRMGNVGGSSRHDR